MNHALYNLSIKIFFFDKMNCLPLNTRSIIFKNVQRKENLRGTDIISYAAVYFGGSKNRVFMAWGDKQQCL